MLKKDIQIKQDILNFLTNQKLITLSTIDKGNKPWISNVYFGNDKDLNFYIITDPVSNHGEHFSYNKNIAFTTVWFNPNDKKDRKSIQAKGIISRLDKKDYPIFNKYFFKNEGKDYIDKVLKNEKPFRFYIIKSTYLKFWNDELYGIDGTKELFL